MTTPSSRRNGTLHCLEFHRLLPLYVGGDLDEASAPHFDDHMLGCLPCSEQLDAFIRQRGLLSDVGRSQDLEQWAPDIWRSLRARLDGVDVRRLWPPQGI